MDRRQFLAALLAAPLAALVALGLRKKAIKPRPDDIGVSMRMIRYWDGEHDFYRMDVFYGIGRLRPELSCKILG